jgi:FkbM family methyltransferase
MISQPPKGRVRQLAGNVTGKARRRFHSATNWRFSRTLSVSRDQDGLFLVNDGDDMIYVARPSRIELQENGIRKRQDFLFHEYLGNACSIQSGDIVVDCGANIGEFALACRRRGAVVHAFEPDPQEYQALCKNADNQLTGIQAALWHEAASLEFYLENDTGDSSLFKQQTGSESIRVDAMRLDEYLDRHVSGNTVQLLKLEAEGAEPEILAGTKLAFKRIAYIAADMGPERGLERQSTLVEVSNLLVEEGFRFIAFNSERCTAVFQNISLLRGP